MADYTFSTVKIVAHAARGESVNIGILLYDSTKRLLYRRITDNWAEVRRRTGVESLPDLGALSGPGPVDADDGYLDSLSDNALPSGIVVTKPRALMPFNGHRDALEWAFASQVGVPDAEAGRKTETADSVLAGLVRNARFPPGCYARWHEFSTARVPIRFPHVFKRDAMPHAAIFSVSLAQQTALAYTEQRLYEVMSIREWTDYSIDFAMFAVHAKSRPSAAHPDASKCIAMAKARNVSVVDSDGIRDVLDGIRRRVAPAPLTDYVRP